MLLISDANIFIDLEKIGLLDVFHQLSHRIVTTDFIYNELYSNQKEKLDILKIEILTFNENELIDFYNNYTKLGKVGISSQDYSLIYKAKKIKGSIITGDKALKNYIKRENINVFGVFFILDEILKENLISNDIWKSKLLDLQNINKRLPKKEFEKRLNTY
jgi:predicted nucleic acid-binding protein